MQLRLNVMSPAGAGGMPLQRRLVRDLMTTRVITMDGNASLRRVDDVMRIGGIRHKPIVNDNGSLEGIVTQRDLFRSGLLRALGFGSHASGEAPETLVVRQAMKTDPVTTTPDVPVTEAAKLMLERKIGCLVVLEAGQIAGILTESDFVRHALE